MRALLLKISKVQPGPCSQLLSEERLTSGNKQNFQQKSLEKTFAGETLTLKNPCTVLLPF